MRCTILAAVLLVACASTSSERHPDRQPQGVQDLRSAPGAELHGHPCEAQADCGSLTCTSWQREGTVCRIPCSEGDLCPPFGGVAYAEGEELEGCAEDGFCPVTEPDW